MSTLKLIIFTLCISFFCVLTGNASAQTTCTTPGTPADVQITYPACQGVDCNFSQATCTWGAATGAGTYTVKITEVDTGSVLKTESLSGATLAYTFTVTSGKTYQCDVTAVNTCGSAGATGSDSLLCQTDIVGTPAPTSPPVAPPPPPVAGNEFMFAGIGLMGTMIILLGAVFFVL